MIKEPKECTSADEIRNEIDRIDRQILTLFSERHMYVEAIVKFKNDQESVIALERKKCVIAQRKNWATEMGLNAEIFEKIYELLIESNIEHELEIFNKTRNHV